MKRPLTKLEAALLVALPLALLVSSFVHLESKEAINARYRADVVGLRASLHVPLNTPTQAEAFEALRISTHTESTNPNFVRFTHKYSWKDGAFVPPPQPEGNLFIACLLVPLGFSLVAMACVKYLPLITNNPDILLQPFTRKELIGVGAAGVGIGAFIMGLSI